MSTIQRRRTTLLAALAVVGLSAGCGTIPTPAPSVTPVVSESATPTESPTAGPTESPTPSPAASGCLTGSFSVVSFTATSGGDSGSGGDLIATFSDGTFAIVGAGQKPLQVTVNGTKADALVNGSIQGTFTADGSNGTYAVTGNDGSAKVSAGFVSKTVPMSDVVTLLTPDGTGTVSCTGDQATMSSASSGLELQRAG